MVTENVRVVISERGARSTAQGITKVGRASRKATIAVSALLGALAGFLTFRALGRVAADAISTAASFEQFEIQIAALLGSQKEANLALENFIELAAKTPFAVSDVVAGATALGAAAIGNRERLEELTQTAANLAAVTGLSFTQAAENLQRALSSAGIASADLFRERGVTGLLSALTGIVDITKATPAEIDAAFRQVFGAEGTFGTAAEDLSLTLGGALSNIGDAAEQASKALGDAFAPAVTNAARQVLIPFFKDLEKLIIDNDTEIREFAASVIKFVIPALTGLARAGLAAAATFVELKTFAQTVAGAFAEFELGQVTEQLALFESQVESGARAADNPALLRAREEFARLTTQVDGLAVALLKEEQANDKFLEGLDAAAAKLGELDALVEGQDFSKLDEIERPDIDLGEFAVGGTTESTKELADRERALKQVLQITNRLRVSGAARLSGLQAQLERLRQQAIVLQAAAVASGDEGRAREGLLLIEQQILSIRQEEAEIAAKAAADAAKEAKEKEKIRKAAATEIGGQFLQGLRTEGESAITDLGAFAEESFAEAIGTALQDAGDLLAEGLEEAFEDIDFGALGGEFGSGFGGAIAGAAAFGLSTLARELGGGSANARTDLVRSATQSAQATRGVVAGPTSIPIFQVGQQLEEALIGTEDLLGQILTALQTTPPAAAAAGTGAGVEGGASADLSLTTSTLA